MLINHLSFLRVLRALLRFAFQIGASVICSSLQLLAGRLTSHFKTSCPGDASLMPSFRCCSLACVSVVALFALPFLSAIPFFDLMRSILAHPSLIDASLVNSSFACGALPHDLSPSVVPELVSAPEPIRSCPSSPSQVHVNPAVPTAAFADVVRRDRTNGCLFHSPAEAPAAKRVKTDRGESC